MLRRKEKEKENDQKFSRGHPRWFVHCNTVGASFATVYITAKGDTGIGKSMSLGIKRSLS